MWVYNTNSIFRNRDEILQDERDLWLPFVIDNNRLTAIFEADQSKISWQVSKLDLHHSTVDRHLLQTEKSKMVDKCVLYFNID